MRKLFTQNDHFPVQPDYVLEQIAVPFDSSVEKQEFMLGSTRLYLDDERLVTALKMLTEREQLIFEKFYIEDYSDKAIGEWLNRSERSVATYRYRALRRIRETLGADYEKR